MCAVRGTPDFRRSLCHELQRLIQGRRRRLERKNGANEKRFQWFMLECGGGEGGGGSRVVGGGSSHHADRQIPFWFTAFARQAKISNGAVCRVARRLLTDPAPFLSGREPDDEAPDSTPGRAPRGIMHG